MDSHPQSSPVAAARRPNSGFSTWKLFGLLLVLASTVASARAFEILGTAEALRPGDVVSFVAMGTGHSLAALPGGDTNGAVGPAVQDGGERSITRWRVEEPAQGIYSFRCLGINDGPMWLDGHTMNGTVVTALSPVGVSGAAWGLYREGAGFALKCLGKVRGPRWLTEDAGGSQVSLAEEETAGLTIWQVRIWSRSLPTERGLARGQR